MLHKYLDTIEVFFLCYASIQVESISISTYIPYD